MLILHYRHLSTLLQHSRHTLHKAQSEAAHMLLDEIVQALNLPHSPIVTAEKGRPYFKDLPTVDFSLAHTDGFAICALQSCDNGTIPRVGVDAEARTHYSDAEIKRFSLRFFGKHEQDYIENATDRQAAFTKVFVRKEAYAKYCGDGLGAHLSKTDTMAPEFEESKGVRFFSYLKKNIFISFCNSRECDEEPAFL